ncbi:hypothetical protein [Dactylosporangium maewongense]|uniref:hypothetical protein n=1 Tax=Dactylosporangium maewongense TaxID=634393 RepID=UPI0031D7B4D2
MHHWFNGLWGRFNRRDVYIRTSGPGFELELRQGGAEGKPWRRTFPTLDAAVDEAERHMAPEQRWTDLMAAHRRGAVARARREPHDPASP